MTITIANAPSQAHCKAHKTQTQSQPCKEPALCQRTGNTLRVDTDRHSR